METATNTTTPRWAIYVAVPDNGSPTAMEERCRRIAREILGFTTEPVRVWSDTDTKPGTDRPGRDAMLQAADRREFSILVTPAPHRISRDAREYSDIVDRLDLAHVRVDFADRTTQWTHMYRRVSSVSQGAGMGLDLAAQQAGTPAGSGPYGYAYDPATKATVVRRISGMADNGVSPQEIAKVLNEEGIKTQRGKEWTAQAVRRVLRNSSSAMNDSAAFRRVQEKLNQSGRRRNALSGILRCGACEDAKPFLGGLLKCGKCNWRMIVVSTKERRLYRCMNSIRDIDRPQSCDARAIGTQALDKEVWARVREMVNNPAEAMEAFREGDTPMTADKERTILDYCRRVAPELDALDRAGQRNLLIAIGIRVRAEKGEDGIRITVRLDVPFGGTH